MYSIYTFLSLCECFICFYHCMLHVIHVINCFDSFWRNNIAISISILQMELNSFKFKLQTKIFWLLKFIVIFYSYKFIMFFGRIIKFKFESFGITSSTVENKIHPLWAELCVNFYLGSQFLGIVWFLGILLLVLFLGRFLSIIFTKWVFAKN